MKNQNRQFDADELNLVTLAEQYSDNDKARELLERLRWPDGPSCPHCKNKADKPIYRIAPSANSKSPARKGLFKCGACRKQFTVTVGTIFEDSHIPISKWLMAYFILCSAKKSISAHQLHRMLDITYKTAWFMAHRIRYSMKADSKTPKLTGTVEVDETFVGGKCELKDSFKKKTPVVALVQRDGPARIAVVSNVTQKNLGAALAACVDKSAIVNTDEHGAYRNPLKQWKAHHKVVHSKFEYTRKLPDGSIASVNSCESFFSLLKRGVHGSWHHVSREHLPKYAEEFAFRWTHRKVSDGERTVTAIQAAEGKRLTYRQTI